MLEKLWEVVENSTGDTVKSKILAVSYFNSPSNNLKDIQADFDNWSIDDFESIIEEIHSMPTIEAQAYPETIFGVVNYTCSLAYNEGYSQTRLTSCVWDSCKPTNKKFF